MDQTQTKTAKLLAILDKKHLNAMEIYPAMTGKPGYDKNTSALVCNAHSRGQISRYEDKGDWVYYLPNQRDLARPASESKPEAHLDDGTVPARQIVDEVMAYVLQMNKKFEDQKGALKQKTDEVEILKTKVQENANLAILNRKLRQQNESYHKQIENLRARLDSKIRGNAFRKVMVHSA